MRRVAILKSGLDRRGGAEKMALLLAGAFATRGCQVELLTSGSREGYTLPDGCTLQVLREGPWQLSVQKLGAFDTFCHNHLRSSRPDIVLGLDRNSEQTHLRASNGVHATYLERRAAGASLWKRLSFRCNPLHRRLLQLEKQGFEHPDLRRLIVNSHMVEKEILASYAVLPERISVFHNPVEWQALQPVFDLWPEGKISTAERFQINPDQYHLLFIGHHYERKGLTFLLRGLAALRNPDVHLTVVGRERHPERFEQLAQQLGIAHQVSFLGPIAPVWPLYQMADALVIPSLYDPCANVTVEALAMGLFVLSSPYNGGKELLTPTTGREIAEITNPDCFAAALQVALDHRKELSAAQARRNSVHHLDLAIQMEGMISCCLGDGPAERSSR